MSTTVCKTANAGAAFPKPARGFRGQEPPCPGALQKQADAVIHEVSLRPFHAFVQEPLPQRKPRPFVHTKHGRTRPSALMSRATASLPPATVRRWMPLCRPPLHHPRPHTGGSRSAHRGFSDTRCNPGGIHCHCPVFCRPVGVSTSLMNAVIGPISLCIGPLSPPTASTSFAGWTTSGWTRTHIWRRTPTGRTAPCRPPPPARTPSLCSWAAAGPIWSSRTRLCGRVPALRDAYLEETVPGTGAFSLTVAARADFVQRDGLAYQYSEICDGTESDTHPRQPVWRLRGIPFGRVYESAK